MHLLLLLTLAACLKNLEPLDTGTGDTGTPDTGTPPADGDSDGYSTLLDCDDTRADVNPGAPEACDGVDNDCDDLVDEEGMPTWYVDADSDGFGDPSVATVSCNRPPGQVEDNRDCDDADPFVNPDASEVCDEVDNDCNGLTDELGSATWYRDQDGDGWGGTETVAACAQPTGFVESPGDCDDDDASIFPWAEESCDGVDNDCDDLVDDDVGTTWYQDSDGDGWGGSTSQVACDPGAGWVTDDGDCDDEDPRIYPGATDTCNTIDDDCDGWTDEVGDSVWYPDEDGDGWGGSTSLEACEPPSGYVSGSGDCDDTNRAVNPDAVEVCDEVDNDCDGFADESVGSTWYLDLDGDGWGGPVSVEACTAPAGAVESSGDCDDADADASPGAEDVCDGADNDCDSSIDEDGPEVTCWMDGDGDGWGAGSAVTSACTCPAGLADINGDCSDTDPLVHPEASELCDEQDNDCDGDVDEETSIVAWYLDLDGDGWGDSGTSSFSCSPLDGWVPDAGDCNDSNTTVHPDAAEACDGLDNNCDGIADEGGAIWYEDADGDGWGSDISNVFDCTRPEGYVSTPGDCDDDDPTVNPTATDIKGDYIDQDCDGMAE